MKKAAGMNKMRTAARRLRALPRSLGTQMDRAWSATFFSLPTQVKY